MTMMTPVPGNTPSVAITGIAPVRPVAEPATSFAQDDPGRDRPGDERDRGTETTLRYKFDWLVQRQVSAGTIDPDEAAEMIRLFDRTVADAKVDRDADDAGEAVASGEKPASVPGGNAATALLDRMRERFGVDGPYDDHGGQAASTPVGMIVDEQV